MLITPKDIYNAIKQTLAYNLTDVEFSSNNFKLNFLSSTTSAIATNLEKKQMSFDLVYSSQSEDILDDLLQIQNILEDILKAPLETIINGEYFNFDIEKIEYTISEIDKTLRAIFLVEIIQDIKESIKNNQNSRFDMSKNNNIEMIEDLNIK